MPSCQPSCTQQQSQPIIVITQQGDNCNQNCNNQCQQACSTPVIFESSKFRIVHSPWHHLLKTIQNDFDFLGLHANLPESVPAVVRMPEQQQLQFVPVDLPEQLHEHLHSASHCLAMPTNLPEHLPVHMPTGSADRHSLPGRFFFFFRVIGLQMRS